MTIRQQIKAERKVLLKELAPYEKELRLAQRRVEKVGAARWFFNFAYGDLESCSAGQLTDYGFDILALIVAKDPKTMDSGELRDALSRMWAFTIPDETLRALDELRTVTNRFPRNTENEEVNTAKKQYAEKIKTIMAEAAAMPRVPLRLIFQLHDKLKEKFDGYFTGHYWEHRQPASVKWLLCPGVRPHDGVWKAQGFGNPAMRDVDQLLLIAGDAITRDKKKFGVCANPKCKNPYMAEKNSLRKHCSDECANLVRVKRYRRLESLRRQNKAVGVNAKGGVR